MSSEILNASLYVENRRYHTMAEWLDEHDCILDEVVPVEGSPGHYILCLEIAGELVAYLAYMSDDGEMCFA